MTEKSTDSSHVSSASTSPNPPQSENQFDENQTAADAQGPLWHTLSWEEAVEQLDVDPKSGLSRDEAERRLEEYGPNELRQEGGIHPWQILAKQFTEPLVIVLIIAAAVSAVLWSIESGEGHEPLPYDAIVILAIVLLNAFLGFFQEYRAEQAVEALKKMASPESSVRRGGEIRQIPATELVPGDVLLLEAGVRIPADARLVQTANLEIEEAALTGESVPVHKRANAQVEEDAPLGDRSNMAFMGSVVTYGRAEAVVTATGMSTQMGGIATLIQGVEKEETPLQKELGRIGKQLGVLVLIVALIVTVTGVLRENSFGADVLVDMFLFGVALAVAAIPEGLQAVVTAVLALGVRRMASRNAIVRRLPAVETLGSATVICSDKTGTLTRNEMTVQKILLGSQWVLDVEGRGYEPEGKFSSEDGEVVPPEDEHLRALLREAALNNDARLVKSEEGWKIEGDPTEGALLVVARKAGLDERDLQEKMPRQGEIPFSSERKRMATIHDTGEAAVAFEKGAPDVVIELCTQVREGDEIVPMSDERKEAILAHNEKFASRALRTLAFASREIPPEETHADDDYTEEEVEHDLVWEGLVGMIDPPRQEAKDSVAQAREAGIRTVMITGDHRLTALAIAKELGIAAQDAEAITGRQLQAMDDDELAQAVRNTNVYARVNPEHKLRIVQALKGQGEVVAMTGDGVNDAPALRQADIGVAMGITGTDVSKEAADMILSDDNFATIVAAIAEGRTILDNLRKFIRYLLSSNAGEVFTMFFAIVLAGVLGFATEGGGLFLPLLAVQILWINLVTDGGPALALGVDPPAPDIMQRPPRDQSQPIIDLRMWSTIGLVGFVMMLGTLFVLDGYMAGGLVTFRPVLEGEAGITLARTAAFTTLVIYQLFNVFNCRSARLSALGKQLFHNRWLWIAVAGSALLHALVVYVGPLQSAFDTVALAPIDWAIATAVAASVLVVMEIAKLFGVFEKR